MTQQELKNIIFKLRICSSNMSVDLINKLINGGSCSITINTIMLLNDYINQLLKYNTEQEAINCLNTNTFNKIYNNATSLCKICDCNNQ